ncbi:uncharacterized protein [Lepeophtheirus salmonis]|uniref:uncharacterized protein n=1 Tax=Lepeophtheirus salmonis TaxID=72036 RepID=UPI001AE5B14D|nr:uncharacterized protein LOC121120541 [Lepeophtheirus salmonis]
MVSYGLLLISRSFSNKVLAIHSILYTQNRLNNLYFGSSNPTQKCKESLFQCQSKIRSDIQLLSLYYIHLQKKLEFESEREYLINLLEFSRSEEVLREYSNLLRYYFYAALKSNQSSSSLEKLWTHPTFAISGFRPEISYLYSESVLIHELNHQTLIDYYSFLPIKSLNLVDSCYYIISLYRIRHLKSFHLAHNLYLVHHINQVGAKCTWLPLYVLFAHKMNQYNEVHSVSLANRDNGSINVKLKLLNAGRQFHEGSLLLHSKPNLVIAKELFEEWKDGMLKGNKDSIDEYYDIYDNLISNGNVRVENVTLSQLLIQQIYTYFDNKNPKEKLNHYQIRIHSINQKL